MSKAWVLLAFMLSGCAILNEPCKPLPPARLLEQAALRPVFADMATAICRGGACEHTGNLLVTDFVSLDSYEAGTSGMLMGELMRASLSDIGAKLIQAEFSKFFRLNQNGLTVLTREAARLRESEHDTGRAIVGTYFFQPTKLTLFVRVMNTQTGDVLRMTSRELSATCPLGRSQMIVPMVP